VGAGGVWTPDRIVAGLGSLRAEAGEVSFGEIAARIARLRESRGMSAAASRVARSTVYDVFRPGRNRLNPDLVAEIVLVLGGDEADADRWRRRCARSSRTLSAPRADTPRGDASRGDTPRADTSRGDASRGDASAPESRGSLTASVVRAPRGDAPAPGGRERPAASVAREETPRLVAVLVIAALCVLANLVGSEVVHRVPLPLYLDMIGTAIAAITLGPWHAAAVAIAGHGLFAGLHSSTEGLPFALVNVTGALIWGYGARAWGLGRTPLRFLLLSLLVALACTVVAVPVIMFAFDGYSISPAAQTLSQQLVAVGAGLWSGVLSANITTSVMDKLIAGFIALAVGPALLRWSGRVTRAADSRVPGDGTLVFVSPPGAFAASGRPARRLA